jgi:hypothetical protein
VFYKQGLITKDIRKNPNLENKDNRIKNIKRLIILGIIKNKEIN